jgi:4-nitrophenol 2-monooxygenase / 4-nitrocatechol 4-monooxygenase, reductase component
MRAMAATISPVYWVLALLRYWPGAPIRPSSMANAVTPNSCGLSREVPTKTRIRSEFHMSIPLYGDYYYFDSCFESNFHPHMDRSDQCINELCVGEKMTGNTPVSAADFKRAVSFMTSAVTVITTANAGRDYGMTASSVTSLSADPPLMVACLRSDIPTARAVDQAGYYVVNILGEDQADLAYQFSRPGPDKFTGVATYRTEAGVAVLRDALVSIVCRVVARALGGTHTMFSGEVLALANKGGKPLAYFRGGFGHFTAAQDEQLYFTLKRRLLRGDLELGAAIDLEAVSAETNSDVNALEKALGRLIGDDLVVRADSGEYRVRPFTAEMACEAFELREVLAREAIHVITAEPPSSLTRELEKALGHMAQEIRENTFLDFSRYVTANCQFYRTLIGGMNNAAAVRAFDSLNIAGIMERSFGLTNNTSETYISVTRLMLEAIKHRLPRDAWTYLHEYTNMAKDRVREIDSTHSHAF